MSHILEGLDQGPPKPNQSIPVLQRHTVAEPEGSQNGRPHFERFPMRIVTIPVHRDVPKSVHNRWNQEHLQIYRQTLTTVGLQFVSHLCDTQVLVSLYQTRSTTCGRLGLICLCFSAPFVWPRG